MRRTNFLMASIIPLALIACDSDKKDKSNPQPKPRALADTSPFPSALLGSWTACKKMPEEVASDFKSPAVSMLAVKTFQNLGQASMQISFHTDEKCQKELTNADVDAYIAKLKEGMGGTVAEEAEIRDAYQSKTLSATYKVTRDFGNGRYDYDVTDVEGTTYSTMHIIDDTLILSYDCDQEDVEQNICSKITGDRPENRSLIDNNAEVWLKKK